MRLYSYRLWVILWMRHAPLLRAAPQGRRTHGRRATRCSWDVEYVNPRQESSTLRCLAPRNTRVQGTLQQSTPNWWGPWTPQLDPVDETSSCPMRNTTGPANLLQKMLIRQRQNKESYDYSVVRNVSPATFFQTTPREAFLRPARDGPQPLTNS